MASSKGLHLVVHEGDVINLRYKVLHEVGCGNFSKVYCCCDVTCPDNAERRIVAVKIVKREYREDAYFEKQMLELIRKKGNNEVSVSQIIAFFEWKRYPVIVLSLHGPSLRRRRLGYAEGIVRRETVVRLAYSLLESLRFIHFVCRMVHTDLKPDNILIADPETPKHSLGKRWVICDFGSSSLWRMDKLDSDLISTRPYRAPEVILGNPWFYAADMWSTGCILFEVATGRRLFEVNDDAKHLQLMEERLGPLPDLFTLHSKHSGKYFTAAGKLFPELGPMQSVTKRMRRLSEVLRDDLELYDLIASMLIYDPMKRVSAIEAMKHPIFNHIRAGAVAKKGQTDSSYSSGGGFHGNVMVANRDTYERKAWTCKTYTNEDFCSTPTSNLPRVESHVLYTGAGSVAPMRHNPAKANSVNLTSGSPKARSSPPADKHPNRRPDDDDDDGDDTNGGAASAPQEGTLRVKVASKDSDSLTATRVGSSTGVCPYNRSTPDQRGQQLCSENGPVTTHAASPGAEQVRKLRQLPEGKTESRETEWQGAHEAEPKLNALLLKAVKTRKLMLEAVHAEKSRSDTEASATGSSASGGVIHVLKSLSIGTGTPFECDEATSSSTTIKSNCVKSSLGSHPVALETPSASPSSPLAAAVAAAAAAERSSVDTPPCDAGNSRDTSTGKGGTSKSPNVKLAVVDGTETVLPNMPEKHLMVTSNLVGQFSTQHLLASTAQRIIVPSVPPLQQQQQTSVSLSANDVGTLGKEASPCSSSNFSTPSVKCRNLMNRTDFSMLSGEANMKCQQLPVTEIIISPPTVQEHGSLKTALKFRSQSCPTDAAGTSGQTSALHPPAPLTLARRSVQKQAKPGFNATVREIRQSCGFHPRSAPPELVTSSHPIEKRVEAMETRGVKKQTRRRFSTICVSPCQNVYAQPNEAPVDRSTSIEPFKATQSRRYYGGAMNRAPGSDTTLASLHPLSDSSIVPTDSLLLRRSAVVPRHTLRRMSQATCVASGTSAATHMHNRTHSQTFSGKRTLAPPARITSKTIGNAAQEVRYIHHTRLPLVQAPE